MTKILILEKLTCKDKVLCEMYNVGKKIVYHIQTKQHICEQSYLVLLEDLQEVLVWSVIKVLSKYYVQKMST